MLYSTVLFYGDDSFGIIQFFGDGLFHGDDS